MHLPPNSKFVEEVRPPKATHHRSLIFSDTLIYPSKSEHNFGELSIKKLSHSTGIINLLDPSISLKSDSGVIYLFDVRRVNTVP